MTPGAARLIGFDLAGPEAGWPAARHAKLLARVRAAGLGLTLHAGETDAGARVLETARLGAQRIGHGLRLADLIGDDPASCQVLAEVKGHRIHLEICPTSKLHNSAAARRAPIDAVKAWRRTELPAPAMRIL